MIEISIPGFHNLQLKHLVLDYNGTLACDGKLIPGVQKILNRLSENLKVHALELLVNPLRLVASLRS
jgi:soluble P-type ATPase